MAAAILETYNEAILPAWKMRKTPLTPFNPDLAAQIVQYHEMAWVDNLAEVYHEWDGSAVGKLI